MIRFLLRLMRLRLRKLSRLWQAFLGIEVPDPFPKYLILPHPYGVVINPNSKIGEYCRIYQNVTIGSDEYGHTPRIGSNVVIYAGACVIGDVTLGDNVVVGANAVVINSVPNGMVAVGVPARNLKQSREDVLGR